MTDPIVDLDTLIECYKTDPRMTHTKWVEWAVLCAERVLPNYEAKHPDDTRPREAINAARRWAANPTVKNRKAARAAYAAAYAADAAAYATYAADAAAYTADAADAADAAAYTADAAAYAAADAAAYAVERQWQAFRLMDVYHGNRKEKAA